MTDAEKLRRVLDDPVLFIQNFIKIVDKRGRLVNFVPNPQQMRLLTEMDKFNVVLKSRQLGISVLSCAYSIWLAIRFPNTSSADGSQSGWCGWYLHEAQTALW